MELLEVDELQANAILDLQLRRLAALERQKIMDEAARLEALITDYKAILASSERQRAIIAEELTEIARRFGDDRRTEIVRGFDGGVSDEDLIPVEEMVVTVTRGGYIKRTRSDNYRSQHRGGKGIRGAQLRADDVVEHFFVTTTHHWLLFFTNLGRVYRTKCYELLEAGRDSKGQHIANLLPLQPGEEVAQILDLENYDDHDYLVLATRNGLVKKTDLSLYDTPRTAGVIAIKLRDGDELVSAMAVRHGDHIFMFSHMGQSLHFVADDEQLRPMGRDTSGVKGMSFRDGDWLINAAVGTDEKLFVFTVTENGYAKRTPVGDYRIQGRGGLGIKVMKQSDDRGIVAGALLAHEEDEVLVILSSGKVVRSDVREVPVTGRDTMGVVFARPDGGDAVIGIARNTERELGEEENGEGEDAGVEPAGEGAAADAGVEAPAATVEADADTASESVDEADAEGEQG